MTNGREKKQCVLVVDDHPKVLKFVEISLKIHGYDVISTTSGEEALELIKSAEPDIMLLDIIMPGIDGFEVLEKLRTFKEIPVIVFSAGAENRDGALLLGANDFILKPFEPDEMISKIRAIMEAKKSA